MIADLRRYPAMNDSGVEWLGAVPKHWTRMAGRACFREKKVPNEGLAETTVLSLSYGKIVVKPPEKLHGLVPASFETYQIVEPGDIIVRPTDLQNDWNSLRFGLSRDRGIITSAYMCLCTEATLMRSFGHLLLHTYDLKKVFLRLGFRPAPKPRLARLQVLALYCPRPSPSKPPLSVSSTMSTGGSGATSGPSRS